MKMLFFLFLSCFINLFYSQIFAQSLTTCSTSNVSNASCAASGVLIYAPGSSSTSFTPPKDKLPVGKLQITYSVTLDTSTTTGFSYDTKKWGVLFGTTNPPTLAYYQESSSLYQNVKVSVDASKISNSGSYYAGTVVVTIDFTNANSVLSPDIAALISSDSLQIQPMYFYNNVNVTNASLAFNWKADTGALLNAPTLTVLAEDSAFIVSLSPPSNLNAATPTPASTPTSLTTTTNSVSGYVLVYWLDTDSKGNATGCKANPGGWQFQMNPKAFSNPSSTPSTCTYTQYQSTFNTGGTSSTLGCPASAITGILPFDSTISSSTLTADATAIPYTPSYTNPTQIPSDSNGTPSGCYNVVYIPSSQTTWSKGNINNGDIYGFMAWALNNATIPNYSLAHSNISYITGVNIPLASLSKSPNLPKSVSDCFVVTAASGNPDSAAVFYWRIIRDQYLTPFGITPYYYQHAKSWANWLDEHPKLKPALNTFLEYSGKFIYRMSGYTKKSKEYLKELFNNLDNLITQKAGAQELYNENAQPEYEIFITGGVLFPTADKYYYDQYYNSQMNLHFEGGGNYIFWFKNLGLSTGLLGRYLTNTSSGSVNVLGTQQSFSRTFYSTTAEALVGLRYRDPCWSYIQPGIFAGVGVSRFREEATTGSSSTTTQKPAGVTNYSAIYEFGGNLDFNLVPLFSMTNSELGSFLSDISLRISASYNINPTPALSSTGIFVQTGFTFLLR
ncbi:hypothetical protein [Silvanigrella aquatica]|uniref:Ig-like domain-containing protein n=1 Tax=Silvanigrella aquatica TaxID=1915309 RepID=A0A1L4D1P2_9BACT|nr:hypothetical protein [Silvanigrella aquatica]APJ04123.1 hypothetical protein AXG55_09470 [Silvanigrella aquatica]